MEKSKTKKNFNAYFSVGKIVSDRISSFWLNKEPTKTKSRNTGTSILFSKPRNSLTETCKDGSGLLRFNQMALLGTKKKKSLRRIIKKEKTKWMLFRFS